MPDNRKEYKRNASVLQVDVVNFVKRCLETDAAVGLRKQHHTAKRIYDRLVDEYNFTGGESTIRRLVQDLRIKTTELDRLQ